MCGPDTASLIREIAKRGIGLLHFIWGVRDNRLNFFPDVYRMTTKVIVGTGNQGGFIGGDKQKV